MPAVLRATVSFQPREASTASNFFFGIAINQFQWCQDTHRMITLQEVHRIEAGLAPVVRQMLEIPAHDEADLFDGGNGDMARIVHIVRRNDASLDVSLCELFRFSGQ